MLNQIIIFLLILLVIGIIAVIILLIKKTTGAPGADGEKLAAMMERLTQLGEQNKELRQAMDGKLAETHRSEGINIKAKSMVFSLGLTYLAVSSMRNFKSCLNSFSSFSRSAASRQKIKNSACQRT